MRARIDPFELGARLRRRRGVLFRQKPKPINPAMIRSEIASEPDDAATDRGQDDLMTVIDVFTESDTPS